MATHVLDPQPQHEHNPPSSSPSAGYKVCKGKRIPHHDFDAQDSSRQTLRPPKTFPYNKHLTTVTLQHTQKTLAHIWSSKIPKIQHKACTSNQSTEKRLAVSCKSGFVLHIHHPIQREEDCRELQRRVPTNYMEKVLTRRCCHKDSRQAGRGL